MFEGSAFAKATEDMFSWAKVGRRQGRGGQGVL